MIGGQRTRRLRSAAQQQWRHWNAAASSTADAPRMFAALAAADGRVLPQVTYDIRVQMLEVYNDTLLDLLAPPPSSLRGCPPAEALKILGTQASGCNVQGACQMEVHTTDDVLALMVHGAQSRTVGETALNARSSRSHEVLTILVDGLTIATGARSHGCLHLVDLAGSERVAKSGATGAGGGQRPGRPSHSPPVKPALRYCAVPTRAPVITRSGVGGASTAHAT
jgi:hypothetical protein